MPDSPATPFVFLPLGKGMGSPQDTVVRLGEGITTPAQLMAQLGTALGFPPNATWDELADCLGEMAFPTSRIILLHESVPALGEAELRGYLDAVAMAIEDWQEDGHELIVAFPETGKARICDAFA